MGFILGDAGKAAPTAIPHVKFYLCDALETIRANQANSLHPEKSLIPGAESGSYRAEASLWQGFLEPHAGRELPG